LCYAPYIFLLPVSPKERETELPRIGVKRGFSACDTVKVSNTPPENPIETPTAEIQVPT
jgi:hypothetical protein